MPGGWPNDEIEREACARALLACGGDFERIYDEAGLGLDAYIRHIIRVPFFKRAQEDPIVLATGKIQTVVGLLGFYTRLYELTDQFDKASWIVYLVRNQLGDFLSVAESWGDVEYVGDEMYCWYTSPAPILLISSNSDASGLLRAVADLEAAPESGVIAVTSSTGDNSIAAKTPTRLPAVAASGLSSGSIARLRLEAQKSGKDQQHDDMDHRSPTPPGNPRIRRNTG